MARVYLGVGSNIERERYITAGLDALQALFGTLEISSVYDSPAIGFRGQPFLNLVVGADTEVELGELAPRLRHIEYEHGRPVDATRFSARQLDIDVLTYGDLVGTVAGVDLPGGKSWKTPSCCGLWRSWPLPYGIPWRGRPTPSCGAIMTGPASP